jgi:hypothetical protein
MGKTSLTDIGQESSESMPEERECKESVTRCTLGRQYVSGTEHILSGAREESFPFACRSESGDDIKTRVCFRPFGPVGGSENCGFGLTVGEGVLKFFLSRV